MFGIVNDQCNIPRVACEDCRNGERGFPQVACPHGYSKERLPLLAGDAVESLVPKALKKAFGCYDKKGNLKPESGCGKRKVVLNRFVIGVRKS